jgi:O-antigen/teichoic acid export membrane protein
MSHKRKILHGSVSNMARVILSLLVAVVVPPFLVHRMTPAEYSAWVLILQCSAYINLLDLGLQAAIGKFISEYDGLGDLRTASLVLSSSFAILCLSALLGATAVVIVTWKVPDLFHQMPTALIVSVREGFLLVGLSIAIALPFSAFAAVFTGLQEYGFPTAVAMIGKIGSSAGLVGLLLMRANLVELACVIALFNVTSGIAVFLGWKKYASERVQFALTLVSRHWALRLAKYGSVLSLWTVAMLLISGLDIVVVGHYDYKSTGYYGIASTAANLMVVVIGSLFGPLLPAISSLQSGRTASQLGSMMVKATRYCSLLISLVALPLVFAAYPLLKLWVGHDYAIRSAKLLEVLALGNAVRQLGYPYALVVVATGKQHLATLAAILEATANLTLSIFLVQRIGAIGVAIGTLVGGFVSLGLHLTISMRLTMPVISMSRRTFLLVGLLRPLLCVVPSLLLLPVWLRSNMHLINAPWAAIWILSTCGVAWFGGLTSAERSELRTTTLSWHNRIQAR